MARMVYKSFQAVLMAGVLALPLVMPVQAVQVNTPNPSSGFNLTNFMSTQLTGNLGMSQLALGNGLNIGAMAQGGIGDMLKQAVSSAIGSMVQQQLSSLLGPIGGQLVGGIATQQLGAALGTNMAAAGMGNFGGMGSFGGGMGGGLTSSFGGGLGGGLTSSLLGGGGGSLNFGGLVNTALNGAINGAVNSVVQAGVSQVLGGIQGGGGGGSSSSSSGYGSSSFGGVTYSDSGNYTDTATNGPSLSATAVVRTTSVNYTSGYYDGQEAGAQPDTRFQLSNGSYDRNYWCGYLNGQGVNSLPSYCPATSSSVTSL